MSVLFVTVALPFCIFPGFGFSAPGTAAPGLTGGLGGFGAQTTGALCVHCYVSVNWSIKLVDLKQTFLYNDCYGSGDIQSKYDDQ